jgi:c-di-GMP-binding flagellar brake protein YcgR
VQERRNTIRRQADRDLLRKVEALQELIDRRGVSADKELERTRRHIIRHNCKVSIVMPIAHVAAFQDTWSLDSIQIKGRILDLSGGGASLFTEQEFQTGQELQLTIRLRDGSDIHAKGSVRWVKAIPEKQAYASGVQFLTVADKDLAKVRKFLEELDATAGL